MSPRKKKTVETYIVPVDFVPFQITEEDIKQCPNIGNKNIGKWAFMKDGCYSGFFATQEKVQKWITELDGKMF